MASQPPLDETEEVWPVEDILNSQVLFLRVAKNNMAGGKPLHGAFKRQVGPNGDKALSVDWSRYSTAAETRMRASKPQETAVVSLSVAGVRAESFVVVHDPIRKALTFNGRIVKKNRAHSRVSSQPWDEEHRFKLVRIANVEISEASPLIESG